MCADELLAHGGEAGFGRLAHHDVGVADAGENAAFVVVEGERVLEAAVRGSAGAAAAETGEVEEAAVVAEANVCKRGNRREGVLPDPEPCGHLAIADVLGGDVLALVVGGDAEVEVRPCPAGLDRQYAVGLPDGTLVEVYAVDSKHVLPNSYASCMLLTGEIQPDIVNCHHRPGRNLGMTPAQNEHATRLKVLF